MADRPPLWLQGFTAIERRVAPTLEGVIQSEQFAVAIGLIANAQRTVQRQVSRSTRRWLHLWNLPAGTDVTRILNELGTLQREVHDLTKRLQDIDDKPQRSARPRSPRR